MKSDSSSEHIAYQVSHGWIQSGSLLGSVLSGMILGLLADRWLGTDPWLVVVGILVGSYSGFLHLWHQSKAMETGKDER